MSLWSRSSENTKASLLCLLFLASIPIVLTVSLVLVGAALLIAPFYGFYRATQHCMGKEKANKSIPTDSYTWTELQDKQNKNQSLHTKHSFFRVLSSEPPKKPWLKRLFGFT